MLRTLEQDDREYHAWLRTQCKVSEAGLKAKAERMRDSAFKFLRATYFRWATTVERLCPELAGAPRVASIGDIHVENFGTWRDAEGRLVWGVNDYDEVATMPYAYDMVRLATSALLAPGSKSAPAKVAAAVVDGYRAGWMSPAAALLDDNADWLRDFANPSDKSRRDFWTEIEQCEDVEPPSRVRRALVASLPPDGVLRRFASRIKGGGSLGRPRFVAVAEWNGGLVLREAKAHVPSAWSWAHARSPRRKPWHVDLARGSFRSPDPSLHYDAGFTIRRIAPDSRKIDLADVGHALSLSLLHAMAADVASVHASDPRATRIFDDLKDRPPDWLERAAATAAAHCEGDFAAFRARPDRP